MKLKRKLKMKIKSLWWRILSRIVSDEYIESCAYEMGMDF